MPNVGVYCLNAARFISGEKPYETVVSTTLLRNDPRFTEVESSVHFVLRFPSGFIATSMGELRRPRIAFLSRTRPAGAGRIESGLQRQRLADAARNVSGRQESVNRKHDRWVSKRAMFSPRGVNVTEAPETESRYCGLKHRRCPAIIESIERRCRAKCVAWRLLTVTYLFERAAPPLIVMPPKDGPACVIG
jgi:hypothetical protein